jgi:hypothetical protein
MKCSSIELAITSDSGTIDRIWNPMALPPLHAILRVVSKVPLRLE